MHDPTIPRVHRVMAGRYQMLCGEECVDIWSTNYGWEARAPAGAGEATQQRVVVSSFQRAKEWAYDWLTEHA